MTPQERALLENFLSQLVQIRGVNKDPEAQRLIQQAVEQQPDATYLVVQRALLLTQALEQAKARIAELEEVGREQGFLDPSASGWGNPAAASPGAGGYGAQPGARGVPPGYPPAAYPTYPPAGGGFSSFLGQAAATAAGVAGGEFLFQGLENMFGHHGGAFGGGGLGGPGFGAGPGFAAAPIEDVTINNYYAPEEVIVDNDFNSAPPDDTDTNFGDDNLTDDQDFV